MAKPRPLEAYFADNPQLTKVLQNIYDELTKDTIYDDTDVLADIATNTAAIVTKLQTATYTEKWQECGHAVNGVWTNVDLSGYGVLAGDICDFIFDSSGAGNNAGVRIDGSGLDRRVDMGDSQTMAMSAKAGTGGIVEAYFNDATEFDFYLAGYWRFSTS